MGKSKSFSNISIFLLLIHKLKNDCFFYWMTETYASLSFQAILSVSRNRWLEHVNEPYLIQSSLHP